MAKRKRRREHFTLEYPGHAFEPLDVADFVQTSVFSKDWDRLGLTDDDLRLLEISIMTNPRAGPVMKGTGGLRKIRFSPPGWARGKSGALRACYVYFERHDLVLLVALYEKGEKDDLSPEARKAARSIIERQEQELSRRPVR